MQLMTVGRGVWHVDRLVLGLPANSHFQIISDQSIRLDAEGNVLVLEIKGTVITSEVQSRCGILDVWTGSVSVNKHILGNDVSNDIIRQPYEKKKCSQYEESIVL